ncbi:MBL fold metallo-hydrolase [Kibdelosporangium phytohabitans]|uniref:MBL fold metallo-hydrolase n=1 Tax=Kibdelosporangium phytohabitans TaxID=860235 RepID=A0A0N9IH49_9PSEU|nr:MBL fold metallo-hydrolase [Kibdelosporangium phytohabitans]ALG14226.1 MBL fold metallo-hydrolase [Kibdelosporangium phytohabitans]MBE1466774.1 L-ascorbate metabolism protein UlaG (beta-lactamase superfamily) [Kibdelosporangium phytohabitans]
MQFVHFGHSCVLAENGPERLLFDPGTFSKGFEDVRHLDAVLITHQHPDHLDVPRLVELMKANPKAQLIVDPASARDVVDAGLTARTVKPGERFKVGRTQVNAVGGNHAVIHPEVPVPPNVGYVLDDGAFYHPGDSFYRPDQTVDVLGMPTTAPWQKLSEAIDFLRIMKARVAIPIHEAVASVPQMYYGRFAELGPSGTEVRVLTPGETTAV